MAGQPSEPPDSRTPRRSSRPPHAGALLVRLGLLLAALGAVVLVAGFALETLGGLGGVSERVVAFPVATGALSLGLSLALVGWVLAAPRDALGSVSTAHRIPRAQRRAVLGLSLGALAAVSLVGAGAARSLTLMDSAEFCTSCHAAMLAEATAYVASPHARVDCAHCHIGPGIGWLIRSKWIGLQELVAYTSGRWEQPIPVPVANLRPAQDTCEHCHWPEKFTGDRLVLRPHFAPDEGNTGTATLLVVHTGGGAPGSVGAGGIHYSMLTRSKVSYFAADPERQRIPWVEAIGPDGKSIVYRSTVDGDAESASAASPSADQLRRLDCIDCHNRPTHIFPPPDQALDAAIDSGAIDRSLPFVKREALAVLGQPYSDTATAFQEIDTRLRAFYQQSYPELATTKAQSIDQAIVSVQRIYRQSFFPETKVDWQTYPDNLGHQRAPGCFRCHDGKHTSDSGQVIPSTCDTCHTVPQSLHLRDATTLMLQASLVERSGAGAMAIPHTLEGRADCLRCHASGAQAVPPSHQGRTNDTCQHCHKPDPAAARPPARQVPHVVDGFGECLGCHAQGAHVVPPTTHRGRANDSCQFCHPASPGATVVPTQAASVIPHVVLGRESCLRCHGSGDQAAPADHAGRSDNTCQACHEQDPRVANATRVSHTVARFEDCLGCHAAGQNTMPSDHAGRGNSTCLGCHAPSPNARALRSGERMPHPANIPPCLNCHRISGGEEELPDDHAGRTSGVCRLCH